MSAILYYSNNCPNCKKLLAYISKSPQASELHYICVDNRRRKEDGALYVALPNGSEVLMPPNITKVPALLLLKKGNHVLFGNDIENYLEPKEQQLERQATMGNGEPMAYSFGGAGSFGVESDAYSFWDMGAEDLMAKGQGGARQMFNYATPDYYNPIETPPDNYSPDKVDPNQMEQYEASRANLEQETRQNYRPL